MKLTKNIFDLNATNTFSKDVFLKRCSFNLFIKIFDFIEYYEKDPFTQLVILSNGSSPLVLEWCPSCNYWSFMILKYYDFFEIWVKKLIRFLSEKIDLYYFVSCSFENVLYKELKIFINSLNKLIYSPVYDDKTLFDLSKSFHSYDPVSFKVIYKLEDFLFFNKDVKKTLKYIWSSFFLKKQLNNKK